MLTLNLLKSHTLVVLSVKVSFITDMILFSPIIILISFNISSDIISILILALVSVLYAIISSNVISLYKLLNKLKHICNNVITKKIEYSFSLELSVVSAIYVFKTSILLYTAVSSKSPKISTTTYIVPIYLYIPFVVSILLYA